MLIAAGTGHRPNKLGGYDDYIYNQLVKFAKTILIKEEITYLISGMALGWDQALAEAAINLVIPFEAAIPFKGQENRWPEISKRKYNELLESANFITIVTDEFIKLTKIQVAIMMQKRNEYMINRLIYESLAIVKENKNDTTKLLTLWDGSPGGTANCVKYARSKKVNIIQLWEAYQKWMKNGK